MPDRGDGEDVRRGRCCLRERDVQPIEADRGREFRRRPASATELGSDDRGGSTVNSLDHIGGKTNQANPSLPPIGTGWASTQGGLVSSTSPATDGTRAVVDLTNDHLGGTEGRSLQLHLRPIAQVEEEGE